MKVSNTNLLSCLKGSTSNQFVMQYIITYNYDKLILFSIKWVNCKFLISCSLKRKSHFLRTNTTVLLSFHRFPLFKVFLSFVHYFLLICSRVVRVSITASHLVRIIDYILKSTQTAKIRLTNVDNSTLSIYT